MARTTRKSRSDNLAIWSRIKEIFTSSQGFPIFLTLTAMAILFVLFRMKSVEIDYEVADINRKIEKVSLENKELKARRAQMLSVNRLRDMADRHDFTQPRENQIILIP